MIARTIAILACGGVSLLEAFSYNQGKGVVMKVRREGMGSLLTGDRSSTCPSSMEVEEWIRNLSKLSTSTPRKIAV